ncbi:MAG: SUMF1/EgtB/PvdO family nonheme iron enzyme [Deltaproteobacteria bacterium]|nr:SUMF1/EgtB/PvdO family nonheme iron enzyme [Deltaproteobacteria bacterium]
MHVIAAVLLVLLGGCGNALEVEVRRQPPAKDDDDDDAVFPAEPVEEPVVVPEEEPVVPDEEPVVPDEQPAVARGFTGSGCDDDDGCEGFCLGAGEGFPAGSCSVACERYCDDAAGSPLTFCVDDPADVDEGVCVSRCDVAAFPGSGCRAGYACVDRQRHGESTVRDVCWPDGLPFDDVPPVVVPPPAEEPVDDGVCTEDDLPTPNAGLVEPAGSGGCLPGMAPVGELVCMDRWEAFLEEDVDGALLPFSPFAHPGARSVVARSAPGAVPQGYITGREAAAACGAAGKRLCSDTEWLRACRGATTTTYPYGNTRQPGVCNDARAQHPAVEYFGTGANWIWSELGHPCINQLDNSVALTGSKAGCVADDGHYDLMGNLHEWTSDPAGTFRGGFYADTRVNGEGCLYRTTAHDVGHWDYSTGFRCCADR